MIDFIIKPGNDAPGDAIIEAATDKQCEMIVSGTRGLDAKQKAILGSTSDYLVQKSPIPVVILPKIEGEASWADCFEWLENKKINLWVPIKSIYTFIFCQRDESLEWNLSFRPRQCQLNI